MERTPWIKSHGYGRDVARCRHQHSMMASFGDLPTWEVGGLCQSRGLGGAEKGKAFLLSQ